MYGPSLNHIGIVYARVHRTPVRNSDNCENYSKAYLLILMWMELVFVEKIYGLIRPVLFHFIIIHDQGYDWLSRN